MFTTEALTALISLTFMEIVLGIDNIIFITIITSRLPKSQQNRARNLGISFALLTRLLLLFSINWIMGLTQPLFEISSHAFSFRDIILFAGGLFLIAKATKEIHDKLEGLHDEEVSDIGNFSKKSLGFTIVYIMILDIIFSLDSVVTAVGMAQQIEIMVIAMIASMLVMLASASAIGTFVEKHPTVKILALAFLILIGVFLMLEGMHTHVDKNYVYFAMFFAFAVELINMKYRRVAKDKS
jgi:predicted tellurium resistance membrane protein TerC